MLTRKMNEKKKAPPELVHYDVAFAVKLGRIQGPKPGRALLVSKQVAQVAQVGPMRRIQSRQTMSRWEHVGGGERALRYRQVRLHPTLDTNWYPSLGNIEWGSKQQAASSKQQDYVLR